MKEKQYKALSQKGKKIMADDRRRAMYHSMETDNRETSWMMKHIPYDIGRTNEREKNNDTRSEDTP